MSRVFSSDEMLDLAHEAGLRDARCETKPRSFGWLCCLAQA